MASLFVIYSKYLIILFLAAFLGCGLYGLSFHSVREQGVVANVECVFLFLMQFSAFLTIVLRTQQMRYLILYAFLQVLTLALPVLGVLLYPGINRLLLNHMCMLLSAGMIILTRLDMAKAKRQLAIAAASFTLGLLAVWVMKSFKVLKKLGWVYMAVGLLAIGAVLVLGQLTRGAKLSFTVAGITFQPSEFVKILYVLFLASLLAKDTGIWQVVLVGVGAAAHVLVLVFSKDLGSALIYFAVYMIMVTVACHRIVYLLLGTAAGAGASVVAYRLFSHVQVRFQAWKDPWSVIDDQGYQITQSLFAMSRGGWFGLGIGKGTPGDIPHVETDFVFSAVVEELGLLFGIGIVGVGIVIFLQLIQLAADLKDGFYKNLAVGIGFLYIFQMFLTVGGGTKFIPLTGVTLPFISYGGSSVMATTLLFFMAEGIFVMRQEEELKIERRKKQKGE